MDQAQQDILQSDVLKKLGALESSSRNSNLINIQIQASNRTH
jgi:hypothetical protein